MAINAGVSLPMLLSSGHLGQWGLYQKLKADSSSCKFVVFSLIDWFTALKTDGHWTVQEQQGHVKVKGSQPWYLQFYLSIRVYIIVYPENSYTRLKEGKKKKEGMGFMRLVNTSPHHQQCHRVS